MEEKKVTVVIKDIPASVRDRFKGACAVRGLSMKDELIRLMTGSAETILGSGAVIALDGEAEDVPDSEESK